MAKEREIVVLVMTRDSWDNMFSRRPDQLPGVYDLTKDFNKLVELAEIGASDDEDGESDLAEVAKKIAACRRGP